MQRLAAAQPRPSAPGGLFRSYFAGGFECSTHRPTQGRRLDLVASTRHDLFAREDYERLRSVGILTAREGIRWHLIEREPRRFDFSSVRPILEAARASGVEVIWDLWHYGWPDHLDLWSEAFPARLGELARAFAFWLRSEGAETRFFTPVNEISFSAWACAETGAFFPYSRRRGGALKEQLVRAAVAAIEGTREVSPQARTVLAEPAIHVTARATHPEEREQAEGYRQAQFEALEMLAGRRKPELGGREEHVDVVGINYYHTNQWYFGSGRKIPPGHQDHRPLRDLLAEWHQRFRRPMLIAETGIEDAARPRWLRYVCREVDAAAAGGVPLNAICLYPILNHPGWTNDRHCRNGLWDYADEQGRRRIYEPLARELRRQVDERLARAENLEGRAS
jgi:beta-glucosidase/6-phospho-beta-glucosidase/beta-galactosidase